MANVTKEELAQGIADIEQKANRVEMAAKRWKNLHGGVSAKLGVTAKVAPFTPVLGMVVTYATGYADSQTTSPDVKNPVTIAVGVTSWVTSAGAAWFKKPILAVSSGAVATATLGALMHDVGFAKGQESKAAG